MNPTHTPRLATWLLSCMGLSNHNDAILGDLLERYHRETKNKWYWKQILMAVLAGLGQPNEPQDSCNHGSRLQMRCR
jgi:hypothetical protein